MPMIAMTTKSSTSVKASRPVHGVNRRRQRQRKPDDCGIASPRHETDGRNLLVTRPHPEAVLQPRIAFYAKKLFDTRKLRSMIDYAGSRYTRAAASAHFVAWMGQESRESAVFRRIVRGHADER